MAFAIMLVLNWRMIMKKFLIPSAILAVLIIGGTMSAQPAKPIKQDSQSTNVTTPTASFDAVPVVGEPSLPVDQTPAPDTTPATSDTTAPADTPITPVIPVPDTPKPTPPTVSAIAPTPQPPQKSNETSNVVSHPTSLDAIQIIY